MIALAPEATERLAVLCGIVRKGMETFVEVGGALMEIRDSGLYKERCSTFESFVQMEFGMSRRHAYRQIAAAETVALLGPNGHTPETESVARPLTDLPPDEQQEAWTGAMETAAAEGKKVTAKHVTEAVKAHRKEKARAKTNGHTDAPTNGGGYRGPTVTLPVGATVESVIREAMGYEETGATQEDSARAAGISPQSFAKGKYIVLLADRDDLSRADKEAAAECLQDMNAHVAVSVPFRTLRPLIERVYGTDGRGVHRESKRLASFDRAFGSLIQACTMSADLEVPYLSPARTVELLAEIDEAQKRLRTLRDNIKEYAE